MSFLITSYLIGVVFTSIAVIPFLISLYKDNAPTGFFLVVLTIPFIPLLNLVIPLGIILFTIFLSAVLALAILDYILKGFIWR